MHSRNATKPLTGVGTCSASPTRTEAMMKSGKPPSTLPKNLLAQATPKKATKAQIRRWTAERDRLWEAFRLASAADPTSTKTGRFFRKAMVLTDKLTRAIVRGYSVKPSKMVG